MFHYQITTVAFVALFLLLSAVSSLPDGYEFPYGRIVGGENASIEEHPYQVSLQTIAGRHFCGGSIIDSKTVVTAAHCMQTYKANEFKVHLGSTQYRIGGEEVSVRAFKYHEKYNATSMVFDVAVIKLSTPVRQTSKLRFIQLAEETPKSGTQAVVTGWGTTCFLLCSSTQQLLKVEVNILQKLQCGSSDYRYGSTRILDTMLCASNPGKDACQGDSGGPLVANNRLVGVVSWGNGCAWNGYPGVYCDVASVRKWILDIAATL